MSKILWSSLLLCPAVLAATLPCVTTAIASPKVEQSQQLIAQKPDDTLNQVVRYGKEGTNKDDDTIGQVTSVSQLRDVQPTDWAFQALQSLVERYGVIAGYPDGTFRGNRALTRYEFAAGLNAALNRVNELIGSGSANMVRRDDVATLQRLQQEFGPELASIRGRVDSLEAQTAQLEANQFSTTTKLVGEAIFAISDDLGTVRHRDNATFSDRVRLDFQTSFTGKDTLHTRLAIGNSQRFNFHNAVAPSGFGTFEGSGSLINIFEPNTNNAVGLDWLAYYFPILGNSQVYVAAAGGLASDILPSGNPFFNDGDGGNGAVSVFAQQSPIYRIGGGAGGGVNLALGKSGILGATSLSLAYFADNPANPGRSTGFVNGDFVALGQLNVSLGNKFSIAGTYAHGYHTIGSGIFNAGGPGSLNTPFQGVVGTAQSNDPSILYGAGGERPTVTDSYGGTIALRITKQISFSGFAENTKATIIGRGNGDIWSYGAGLAFPDLGKKGNLLGFFAGVEPTLRGLRVAGIGRNFGRRDEDWHYEAFYKYQVSDNISITPGLVLLTAPGQNIRNNDAWIGTLRTTFTF